MAKSKHEKKESKAYERAEEKAMKQIKKSKLYKKVVGKKK